MADSRHALVFASIIAFAGIAVILTASHTIPWQATLGLVVLIGIGAWVSPELAEFKEYERGVIFRFGRVRKIAGPGWVWFFPRFERYERVDMRTQSIDMPPQETITKDNVKLSVDAIAFWKVKDPLKVILEVRDPQPKLKQLLIASLRQAVAKLTMEQTLGSIDQLNAELSKALKEVATQWGVEVTRVEVQDVKLPEGLSDAMTQRQESEEYKKKVEIDATARKIALDTLDQATSQLSDKTLTYLYIESLKKVADGKSTKILFPLELSKLAHNLSANVGGGGDSTLDYGKLARLFLERGGGRQVEGGALQPKTPGLKGGELPFRDLIRGPRGLISVRDKSNASAGSAA